jgi:glycerate-2-kinase
VLDKYKIYEKTGLTPLNLIETPKDNKYFERVRNILFVSNQTALDAMSEKALDLGFIPRICKNNLSGEARVVAKDILDELSKENNGTVLLYGGETTVKIKGRGRGGRNQEMSLSGLRYINDNQILISVASDGRDNSENAGGICDIITKEKAKKLNLDIEKYLKNNNSFEFFEKTGDYLKTGDTGSNVADIIVGINN